jgi:hypothetical protein
MDGVTGNDSAAPVDGVQPQARVTNDEGAAPGEGVQPWAITMDNGQRGHAAPDKGDRQVTGDDGATPVDSMQPQVRVCNPR